MRTWTISAGSESGQVSAAHVNDGLGSSIHHLLKGQDAEFVVSTLRALDADVQQAAPLAWLLNEMGMPLYACQPPTGYPDRADAWVNSGALLARMNAAVDIVGGRMRGVRVNLGSDATFDESAIHALVTKLVLNAGSPTTRETLERSAGPDQFAVLAIGSPEFQRR